MQSYYIKTIQEGEIYMYSDYYKPVTEADNKQNDAFPINAHGFINYPCCPGEKVMVEKGAVGRVSQKCPNCGKFVVFDYKKMNAVISAPVRGATKLFRARR